MLNSVKKKIGSSLHSVEELKESLQISTPLKQFTWNIITSCNVNGIKTFENSYSNEINVMSNNWKRSRCDRIIAPLLNH